MHVLLAGGDDDGNVATVAVVTGIGEGGVQVEKQKKKLSELVVCAL
jgi:hypothetical protein